ncbi:hypothetical protein DICVIV_02345 [Dictyocaulus viviparus]|uniref:Uncharacterized protein n=1 Tax=Dictyocaulus viviparus TaxID=29172 RepID=A0A0D8Y5P2_DICVI|nr:hypothetical protein DICVIV_02345 [Dictyocaulus viviparus]
MNIEGVVKSGGFVTDKTIPMNEKEHDITVLSRGRFEDEDNDEDSRMSADIGAIKKKYGFSNEPNHLDDYGFVIANRTVCDNSIVPEKESGSSSGLSCGPHFSFVPSALHVNYQPPTIPSYFVSGASPIHLTERYLISFHDVSIHPTIVLDNRATGYVLADLSDQAVALANRIEEKFEQSELFVIHISSWDSESRRWSTNLPQGESALDVMVSREMVCVISDKRKIRIFTLAGTQRHIISHPNPMLTATCFGIHIAICSVLGGDYYEKSCRVQPNYQHVVSIYNVDSKQWYHHKELVKTVNLPVACEKRLLWIGYTNVGQLVSMDSSYSINLLAPSGFWLPIFDGSNEIANKSDAIWPVAVTEGNHRHKEFRYLYCKGSKYPLVAIKMAPVVAPWNLPFCAPDSDKSKLEQELFLNELQMNESFSSESSPDLADLTSTHLKSLVKLFALACKSERDGRAAELAGLVTSAKGILMMCNYAAKLKKSTLADKVASKGRESISLGKPNFYDNSCSNQEEIPMPRPFSLKKKETMQPSSMSAVDSKEYSPKSPSQSNDESNNMENHESSTSQEGNQTISTQCAVPIPRYNKNPFK